MRFGPVYSNNIMGLGVVFISVALFALVFFGIMMMGRLLECICGEQGSLNGTKIVNNKRYGTRTLYSRLQRSAEDRALAKMLHATEKARTVKTSQAHTKNDAQKKND